MSDLNVISDPPKDSLLVNLSIHRKGSVFPSKALGSYTVDYPTESSIISATVLIEPQHSYTVSSNISAISISVSSPVVLHVQNVDHTNSQLIVNSMCFIDAPALGIVVSNSGSNEVRASVTYVEHVGDFELPPSFGTVDSVNGVSPDSSGNVVLGPQNIAGLATVATTGSYNDLLDLPKKIIATSISGSPLFYPIDYIFNQHVDFDANLPNSAAAFNLATGTTTSVSIWKASATDVTTFTEFGTISWSSSGAVFTSTATDFAPGDILRFSWNETNISNASITISGTLP